MGIARMARAVAGMALGMALLAPGTAWAHNAGRVELLVTNLQFVHDPGSEPGVMVHADLIDRDSGASASGFAIEVSGRGGAGAAAGPVTLTDARGKGHYEGMLPLGPGSWTVTATAEQGTSALPALGSTRTAAVKIDANGAVVGAGSHGGGSHTAVWAALVAAALALAAGGFLVLNRRSAGGPAVPTVGQRV
jgi:hypothetical protein